MTALRFGHPSVMGALVVVSATITRQTVETSGPLPDIDPHQTWARDRHRHGLHKWRVWLPEVLPEPRSGWVVGCRQLREGRYHPGHEYVDEWMEAYLDQQSTVPAYLVSFWPSLAHVRVRVDDLRAWEPGDPEPRATSAARRADLSEIYRSLKGEAWPRDARGRFCK